MDATRSSLSLTELQQNLGDYVRKVASDREPVLVTSDEGSAIVLQSAKTYQEMTDRLEYLECVAAIRQGVADVQAGRTRPAREAFAELEEKLGLQD